MLSSLIKSNFVQCEFHDVEIHITVTNVSFGDLVLAIDFIIGIWFARVFGLVFFSTFFFQVLLSQIETLNVLNMTE